MCAGEEKQKKKKVRGGGGEICSLFSTPTLAHSSSLKDLLSNLFPAHAFFAPAAMMLSSPTQAAHLRATVILPRAIAKRAIAPQRACQRPFSAALPSPSISSPTSSSPLAAASAAPCPRRAAVVASSSSPSSSYSPPAGGDHGADRDWLSQGLLRVAYPLQALLLAAGGALMVVAPLRFCELALRSCPLPPPQTAVQLAGAALALPCAASLALAHAASVPGRLSSATYVSLNAGLSLFGLAVAAAASTAVAPGPLPAAAAAAASASSAFLAPAKLYSSLLLVGPLALAVTCSTAATVRVFYS